MYTKYFFLLLVTIAFSCQDTWTTPPTTTQLVPTASNTVDSSYRTFIDALTHLQQSIPLTRDSTGDFVCMINFEDYFAFFDQLHIRKNWELTSEYRHFGDAGRVLLLAFEKGSYLGDSIKQELQLNFEGQEHQGMAEYYVSKKLFAYKDSINFLQAIQLQPTPIGYFQFAVFAIVGDQYCKFGASQYGTFAIITSTQQLQKLAALEDNPFYRFTSEQKEQLLAIDPTPLLTIEKDSATVELLTFSPWRGFIKGTYRIQLTASPRFQLSKQDTLLPYHCGILF